VQHYSYSVDGQTVLGLLDHYAIKKTRWVGTSMGGLIGVTLAAGLLKNRIIHRVVNNIGPDIPAAGRDAHRLLCRTPPVYDTMAEIEARFRKKAAHRSAGIRTPLGDGWPTAHRAAPTPARSRCTMTHRS
jgi:pimeloyl-ACP methyl ester carboxylesterase